MDVPGTTFSYDRLNIEKDSKQIRLLKILPSLSDVDQITCTLEAVEWAPELRYAAISYVWGNPTLTQTISVNGQEFKITENLHSAFWYIRQNDMLREDDSEPTENLPLWVDAVCINQGSIEERNHQVALMSSIYGSASRVICWLGGELEVHPSAQNGDVAIAAIQGLTEAAFHGGLDLDKDSLKDFFISRKGLYTSGAMSINAREDKVWQAIYMMLIFEFWKRIWIVQEIVLPISGHILLFTCRNSVTTWTNIVQFLEIIKFVREAGAESLGLPQEVLYTVTNIDQNWIINLLEYLRQTRRDGKKLDPVNVPVLVDKHKATDPRDYVYGFDAVIKIGHVVDYNKSKKEVYMDWFISVIDSGRVDLIVYAGIGLLSYENPEWPSWLPDLKSIYFFKQVSQRPAQNATTLGDSAFTEASEKVISDVLHISGVKLDDTVQRIFETEVTAPRQPSTYTVGFLHLVCFSILANASEHHPLGIRPLQAFLLTLLNCFRSIGSMPIEYSRDGNNPALILMSEAACRYPGLEQDDYVPVYGPKWIEMGFENDHLMKQALEEQVLGVGINLSPETLITYPTSVASVPYQILSGFEGFTTFQTRNGYIGIGPRRLKEGDAVCFLSRSKTPILLREEKEGATMVTKVVGACYIYGLSDLVIKEWVASGKVNVERFSLH